MRKRQEIVEKLAEAEMAMEGTPKPEQGGLATVIITLRWVLGLKIIQEPTDPVSPG